MATKKEPTVASVVLPPDYEEDTDDFTPIVVEEVRGSSLVKITPKKDFKMLIGKARFTFTKDKPQYVNTFEEKIIRKDGSRLY